MNRIPLWKPAVIALLFSLLFALQPVVSYACASHGGC